MVIRLVASFQTKNVQPPNFQSAATTTETYLQTAYSTKSWSTAQTQNLGVPDIWIRKFTLLIFVHTNPFVALIRTAVFGIPPPLSINISVTLIHCTPFLSPSITLSRSILILTTRTSCISCSRRKTRVFFSFLTVVWSTVSSLLISNALGHHYLRTYSNTNSRSNARWWLLHPLKFHLLILPTSNLSSDRTSTM